MSEAKRAIHQASMKLDQAISDLMAKAVEVARKHDIPEASGMRPAEVLGRLAWVQSASREMRKALEAQIAEQIMAAAERPTDVPEGELGAPSTSLDMRTLWQLQGIPTRAKQALEAAGYDVAWKIDRATDQTLLQVAGIGAHAIAKIRQALMT